MPLNKWHLNDRKKEGQRLDLLQIPPKWHCYPIPSAWIEVYPNTGRTLFSLSLFFFSSLLWFSRRKAALAQEKFPTLNAVISLFFSESSSCDLFTININKCCKVSAKQLQCISCYSADLSWWTSVLGMYFQNKVSIFYCHILYSVWNHPMKNKTEKLRSVDTNW